MSTSQLTPSDLDSSGEASADGKEQSLAPATLLSGSMAPGAPSEGWI